MDNEKKRQTISRDKPQRKELSKGQIKEDLIDIGGRWVSDVIIPKLKDAASCGLDLILYKEIRHGSGTQTNKHLNVVEFTDYNKPYNRNNFLAGSNTKWHFQDVIFNTPEEAAYAWYEMRDLVKAQGYIDLNTYYHDICSADVDVPYTFANYGWTFVGGANDNPPVVSKYINGKTCYTIALPQIRNIEAFRKR